MSEISTLKRIPIPAGQSMFVELGAMEAYPDKTITMNTGIQTSWFSAALRTITGTGNLFLNKFTANPSASGWIALEEPTPGQLAEHQLAPDESIIMKQGAFSACDSNVHVSASVSGVHGYLSKIGFVVLEARTNDKMPGRIFFNSGDGAIKKLEVTDEFGPIIVDNNNIVAYTGGLRLSTTAPGGPISWQCGGEGIATRFTGNGTIYIGSPKSTSGQAIQRAEQAALQAERANEEIKKIAKLVLGNSGVDLPA